MHGQIDAGFEQESAILMQMTAKAFIKTPQKILATLRESLIQSAAGLLSKLSAASFWGHRAGAHTDNCHLKHN